MTLVTRPTVAIIAGARPNFMKVAPIIRVIQQRATLSPYLIHTGQHYDENLSGVFFKDLGIDPPNETLTCQGATHGQQTASILENVEKVLIRKQAEGQAFRAVIVVGDVNSTLAATLAASKLHIPVVHVEAGLRSFDRTMPEEINRIVTDAVSDLLLVSEPEGVQNLLNEGISKHRICLVGNVMIDTLRSNLDSAKMLSVPEQFGLIRGEYCVVTMHRPSNVDDRDIFRHMIDTLVSISDRIPVIFPVHPRTRKRLQEFDLLNRLDNNSPSLRLVDPLGYLAMLCLTSQSRLVITDSGGLQEETTALEIPCLTIRDTTERPITVSEGTSTLLGSDAEALRNAVLSVLDGTYKHGRCPSLWDGRASHRIVDAISNLIKA